MSLTAFPAPAPPPDVAPTAKRPPVLEYREPSNALHFRGAAAQELARNQSRREAQETRPDAPPSTAWTRRLLSFALPPRVADRVMEAVVYAILAAVVAAKVTGVL